MFNEEGADHIREELEALSAAWERAIVANDAEAIGRFMAADWVIVSETGITKKGDFLAVVASGDLTHETFQNEIVSVRQYGGTALLTSRVKNRGAYKGLAFSADEWTTDVFVKTGGEWRCVYSHITTVKEGPTLSTT
jgi:ketosteroid isomerase-like protein